MTKSSTTDSLNSFPKFFLIFSYVISMVYKNKQLVNIINVIKSSLLNTSTITDSKP